MAVHESEAPVVLILSQGTGDVSTSEVMEHLLQMGLLPVRLNGSDFDSQGSFSIRIEAGQVEVETVGLSLDLRNVRVVWFRRWFEPQPFQGVNFLDSNASGNNSTSRLIVAHLLQELKSVGSFIFSELEEAVWLSHPREANPNKLRVLRMAARVGLATPSTLVTTNKKSLANFARRGPVITKPVSDVEVMPIGQSRYLMYTQEISEEIIDSLPDKFFPSLFQEKLEKAYELRVFYLEGDCFSAAIFSQSDDLTRSDFRRYNRRRPNRVVPYRLPAEVEGSICRLMDGLGLQTGSLDLIKTPCGRFVLLEVNPVGQFGMISRPCNLHLEEKIAEFLMRKCYAKS